MLHLKMYQLKVTENYFMIYTFLQSYVNVDCPFDSLKQMLYTKTNCVIRNCSIFYIMNNSYILRTLYTRFFCVKIVNICFRK